MTTYFVKNDKGFIYPTIQPNWDMDTKRLDPNDDLLRYCVAMEADLLKYNELAPYAYDKCDIVKDDNGEYKLVWK